MLICICKFLCYACKFHVLYIAVHFIAEFLLILLYEWAIIFVYFADEYLDFCSLGEALCGNEHYTKEWNCCMVVLAQMLKNLPALQETWV